MYLLYFYKKNMPQNMRYTGGGQDGWRCVYKQPVEGMLRPAEAGTSRQESIARAGAVLRDGAAIVRGPLAPPPSGGTLKRGSYIRVMTRNYLAVILPSRVALHLAVFEPVLTLPSMMLPLMRPV